jgi:hypothetical protein
MNLNSELRAKGLGWMLTRPCPTRRCGQPVPIDSEPWERCLACGQPIKIPKVGARASVR